MFRAVLAAVFAVALFNLTAEPFSAITNAFGASQELVMAIMFAILIKPWLEQAMEG